MNINLNKQEKDDLLWGTIASVIGGTILWYTIQKPTANIHGSATVSSRGNVPRHITSPQPNNKVRYEPNPGQAGLDEAFIQARDQALQAFDQTVLGEKAIQDQLIATNNETAAQKVIAFNQDSTAYKIAGVESTTAQDVAGTQASAAENIASQQASALGQLEHSSQQQSFWGSITSFFSNALGGLFGGFSNLFGGGGAPQGYQTGSFPNTNYYTQSGVPYLP